MNRMTNQNVQYAWNYHNSTKHSYESVRTNPHFLDWANQPRLFKIYPSLDPIPLPKDIAHTGRPALSVIGLAETDTSRDTPVSVEDLASVFHYSAGLTRRRPYSGGEIQFRAAACTGALYSVELYAVCGDLKDLDAGVYVFNPADSALRRLRAGDYRGYLVRAAAGEPSVRHAPVTLVSTGTYWRNAWKYQARTYRHFGWDNGTVLANLLAVAAARKLPARVLNGFVDSEVNHLLGLDTNREVALNLVPLGRSPAPVADFTGTVPPLSLETAPYSKHEVDYPAMREMHAASSLATPEEVAGWRRATLAILSPEQPEGVIPLEPLREDELPKDSIEQVILRRGSSRQFARESISYSQLSTALFHATQGIPADFVNPPGSQLNRLYVIVHAVEGLEPGAYVLHRRPWALELLQPGNFRARAGYLGLEQALPADCSAAIFFLADLNRILDCFGNRGYRATQLEAGIIGGRLYIAAYAQRLGATGLTFYDDEVTDFFSPHAAGKSAIFLVALGKTGKRSWL
jgi:SagB-type dehydrogenase family enzyme